MLLDSPDSNDMECDHVMRPATVSAVFFLLLCLTGRTWALGGDFTLQDHDGEAYSLHDDRGKVVLIAFGYTYCPDVCPTALATVAAALNRLGDRATRVRPLFISLDPQRDTPEHLKAYVRYFHPSLLGLTGDPAALKAVAKRYGVRYSFVRHGDADAYTLDHSANLYIVDPAGKLFRILPHGLPVDALTDSLTLALSLPTGG